MSQTDGNDLRRSLTFFLDDMVNRQFVYIFNGFLGLHKRSPAIRVFQNIIGGVTLHLLTLTIFQGHNSPRNIQQTTCLYASYDCYSYAVFGSQNFRQIRPCSVNSAWPPAFMQTKWELSNFTFVGTLQFHLRTSHLDPAVSLS